MFKQLITLLCFLAVLLVPSLGQAEILSAASKENVTTCPAKETDTTPPDFNHPDCKPYSFYEVDPQGTILWLKTKIKLEKTRGNNGEPLTLYISGKMASRVYLNGVYVGQNGTPGNSAACEIAGRMDAMLYPPQSVFREGDNDVVILASSFHNHVRLGNPIHNILIGTSESFTDITLRRYWPTLLTLGLFILGIFYFGMMALIRRPRTQAVTFAVICTFAAGQLMSEVLRGLLAYNYPVHDLRLISIVICSAGFGLSVAFHVLSTFKQKHIVWIMAALAIVVIIAVSLTNGFDDKALISVVIPLIVCLAASGFWTYQRRPRAFIYFLTVLIFSWAVYIFDSLFLDVVFFYLVAMFLLILFIEQGLELAREMRRRHSEESRADRLQLALEQVKEREAASEITVKSAGKIEVITSDQIIHCSGAGGYSEIFLENGKSLLHSASLADMETSLPAIFLRVHRSHLINTAYVKTLNRDPTGTGTLILSDETEIPVSRRIMPQVRQALG